MELEWKVDLWDKVDSLFVHAFKGIEFSEKFRDYVKERKSVEEKYASNLRNLTSKYRKEENEEDLSCNLAFNRMLKETYDMANQHQLIADELEPIVKTKLNSLRNKLKDDATKQRRLRNDKRAQLGREKDQLMRALEQSKRAFSTWKRSHQNAIRAENDDTCSRADIQKAKNIESGKQDEFLQSEGTYAATLNRFNEIQKSFYSQQLPSIIDDIQRTESFRIETLKEAMESIGKTEESILPILNQCVKGMLVGSERIDCQNDFRVLTNRYKTGYSPPGDIEFIDLKKLTNGSSTSIDHVDHSTVNAKKLFSRLTQNNSEKNERPKEDYSHLPPHQRKIRLETSINDRKTQLIKLQNGLKGMEKLKIIYQKSPQLGDSEKVLKDIENHQLMIQKIEDELKKFTIWHDEAKEHIHHPEKSDFDDDTTHLPVINHNRPSTISMSDNTSRYIDSDLKEMKNGSSPIVEAIPNSNQKSLNYLHMKFDYSGENFHVKCGDRLKITEIDIGDGWTQVQLADGAFDYVPTSFTDMSPSK
ncbi:hypothetical protein SNEBB_005465 [Seison nebaliae]|nr:hypothetical protein SNEBB_005465 [Seison nebaliae]